MAETSFTSLTELQASLAYILQAPKDHGIIETLCYRPTFGERVFPQHITVDPNKGVIGDRWQEHSWLTQEDGSADPRNQVCIIGRRLLDIVWKDREHTIHPGDTIVTDMDLSAANLPYGSLLRIGEVVLEVSDYFNDACGKWAQRYGADSYRWINASNHRPYRLRGIFCRVKVAGSMAIGDTISKIHLAE